MASVISAAISVHTFNRTAVLLIVLHCSLSTALITVPLLPSSPPRIQRSLSSANCFFVLLSQHMVAIDSLFSHVPVSHTSGQQYLRFVTRLSCQAGPISSALFSFFVWFDNLSNLSSLRDRVFHVHQCESHEISSCALHSAIIVFHFSPVFTSCPSPGYLIPHATSVVLPSTGAPISASTIRCRAIFSRRMR